MNNDNGYTPRTCPRCGSPVGNNDTFCGECGANLQNPSMPWEFPYPIQSENTAPLSTIDYLLMILLFSIPIAGLVLMIVWSCSGTVNANRRNFSRAFLIYYVAAFLASIILVFLFYSIFSAYTGF